MTVDRSFVERNRAATRRIRQMAETLSDAELLRPVGQHWTVAITLAHLTFWDLKVLDLLAKTEAEGKLVAPEIDIAVNDIALPLWAAIPPRQAARLALETAEELDRRLEGYPAALLEVINDYNPRWVVRALHRNEHLDEAEEALSGASKQ